MLYNLYDPKQPSKPPQQEGTPPHPYGGSPLPPFNDTELGRFLEKICNRVADDGDAGDMKLLRDWTKLAVFYFSVDEDDASESELEELRVLYSRMGMLRKQEEERERLAVTVNAGGVYANSVGTQTIENHNGSVSPGLAHEAFAAGAGRDIPPSDACGGSDRPAPPDSSGRESLLLRIITFLLAVIVLLIVIVTVLIIRIY